jgi:two-component system, response regulator YesN
MLFDNLSTYRRHSVLLRIFFTYLLLLLVVFVVGLVAFSRVRGVILEKEINLSKQYLNYAISVVDGELLHTKDRMYAALQSAESLRTMLPSTDEVLRQTRLVNVLFKFKNASSLIADCYLFDHNSPIVIGSEDTEPRDELLRIFHDYHHLDRADALEMLSVPRRFRVLPTIRAASGAQQEPSGGGLITLVAGMNYSSNPDTLVATVRESTIRDLILDTPISDYGDVYIVNEDGVVVSSSNRQAPTTAIDPELMRRFTSGRAGDQLEYQKNLVVFRTSQFFNGFYFTKLPYQSILKGFNATRNTFAIALGVLLLIYLSLSVILSRFLYQPIAEIMKKLRGDRGGDQKEYRDEFAFIDGSIEDIQKRHLEHEQNAVLADLVEQGVCGEELKPLLPYSQFQTAILRCHADPHLHGHVSDCLGAVGLPAGFTVQAVASGSHPGDCYLLVNGEMLDPASVEAMVRELKARVESEHQLSLVAGIGPVCSRMEEVAQSVEKAFVAINQGSSQSPDYVYGYMGQPMDSVQIYFPVDFSNKAGEMLIGGRPDGVSALIDEVFDRNQCLPNLYMKILCRGFASEYIRLAGRHRYPIDVRQVTDIVEHEYRIDRVRKFFKSIFIDFAANAGVPHGTPNRVVTFMMDFVTKNYQDPDIKIDVIARALNLTSSYVSTIFRQSTGVTFTEYLQNYRFTVAKKILEDSSDRVKDIAHRVGFRIENSFIRSFRHREGVSPGEYRLIQGGRRD